MYIKKKLSDLYSEILTYQKSKRDYFIKTSVKEWDNLYEEGHWDYLEDYGEAARYDVITGMIRRRKSVKTLLDLGCGSCVLAEYLENERYAYTGIDFSSKAIEKSNPAYGSFYTADVTSYIPEHKYDCIVVNEVLYYISDQIGLIQKYMDWLTEDGFIIISLYLRKSPLKLIRKVTENVLIDISNLQNVEVLEDVIVCNNLGWKRDWHVLLIKNKRNHID
jgi:2-polyprenyl-3-methyl-5-hydroxy-6-metoxy-1,4-benzoquinol methylase